MESSIRGETILNHENARRVKRATGKRSLVHERMQPPKVTQAAAFNRTRGILNLRRVLDGFVNVENEKPYKRSSLQEEKMYSRSSSYQKVVQRCETSPLLQVPLSTTLNNSQNAATTSRDNNQGNVKTFGDKRNKKPENLKCVSDEKQMAIPSFENEPENLKRDFDKKEDPIVTYSSTTTLPPMNVLLEVSRLPSRASWHSPSSIEFSRVSGESPSSDVEGRLNLQPKEVVFDKPTHFFPSRGRLTEKIIPSRVLHATRSCEVSRVRPFEELITKDKKSILGGYYSHPRFNVLGERISCERSLKKLFSSNNDKRDLIGMAVKDECHKNKNVNIRSRKTKHNSKKLLRRLLCCSRRQLSSSSSTNSDFAVKLSGSRTAYTLKNSVVGTNTSLLILSSKATQTFFSHSGKLFPQGKKQDVKICYIPKCDQSTATEEETIEFQETGEKTVIPVHVKCSTTLSLKNKVDGQTRTIKFSDNEIIIEVSRNNTDEIGPKVERLVIEPSREYDKTALPQYLEMNRTRSTKDIHIRTSKMDIPYVASIPAWIWNETSMIFTKNKRDTTLRKLNDHNCNEASNDPSTKVSSHAVPVIVTEEESLRNNEGLEQQKVETGNGNPNKLISCYVVDVVNNPSSPNNNPNRNEVAVNEINKLKTRVRKDAVTQTTFNIPERISVFCQTTECPQRADVDDPERELLYVDYEGQRAAEKSIIDPHHISQSGTRIDLVNISNDPDAGVPPVIVNISHTMSAFKAAAYDHEIEQIKYLERASSQHFSHQKTDGDVLPGSINLKETIPDQINVSDSPDKEKVTDDRHTKSQRVNRKSLIEQERSSSKLERQSKVKEADADQEEVIPSIISTSRPFLRLRESELDRDPSSIVAKPEGSSKTDEKQYSLSSPGGRKSTNTGGISKSSTEKSKGLDKTPLSHQKQRQHYQTGRDSLSRGETEVDQKSVIQNSKNRDKTHVSDITKENRSSQLKTTEVLSRKPPPMQQENVKERLKSRSLLSEPQRMQPIDDSKKASVAFKNYEYPKEEKKNLETIQSSSQSSFIKPSNTSILFVINEPKLAFQGKGKRDRFAARAGVRAPPQRGRARGFGPPPPRSYNAAADPKANKGKAPGKVPLVFGSPSGSFDEPANIKAKKGKQPEKIPVIIKPPSDEPIIYPKKKQERTIIPPIPPKPKPPVDDEEEDEETEITPFPTTMLKTDSTSSSVASSIGSTSESMSSVLSAVSGGSSTSKPSLVSDDSSDAEPTRSSAERRSKSSRRSRRSSARASEARSSVRDSGVIPETRHSTIDKAAISPPEEESAIPSPRVSEQRSSLRGSKYLPDMLISNIDEALKSPKKPDVPSPRVSEQQRSLRDSGILPDKERHSVADESPPLPPPRSSLRDSDFLPKMILSTTDDVIKQQGRSSSRMSEPRSAEGSRSSRGSEPRSAAGSTQRLSDSDPNALPGRKSSTADSARKPSKTRDGTSVSERDRSTSEDARKSSKTRDGTRPSLHHSLIRRSDFFHDADLPIIYDASKTPSEYTYPRKSDRALSSAGGRYLLEDTQVKPSGRSREISTYSSKKSLYDSRPHSVAQEKELELERIRSIEIAKALEHKYSLPDSDESSEEKFQETVISGSREVVTDLPDSSAIEPSVIESDKLRSKEWDSSDLPTTVREVDTIPYESDSKGFTQVEDLGDSTKEREIQTTVVHPPPKPLSSAQVRVPYVKQDKQEPCFVDAKRVARQERRHIHKDVCQPLPRAEKSALNNMCEMFCNIFPCCRKFSVCCKRKGAYTRKAPPSQHAKKREGKSSKSSITSSQLCGKCDKCDSATMSLQGAPVLRQSNPPGPPEITVGYNFTNLYGVYMLALEQSNNSGCVGVQNFTENMFSSAMYPRVYDNSSSSCIFSDLHIKNKSNDSKLCSSEISSNFPSNTYYDFKHTPHSQETAMNDTTCKAYVSEDSQKSVFTTTTPFSLTGTTTTPSDRNELSFQSHERDFSSPPATSCLFDLFSSSSKKLVLSEFYRKNYRKEKSLITRTKKKFRKKSSSQVIDMNFQPMKPKNIKKGNIFEEYTGDSGNTFLNKNKENTTPRTLIQKWSDNYQHLVEKSDDTGLDVTHTRNELFEDFTEGEINKRRKQTENYDPYYHVNEHLKRKKKEFVDRLENRNEISFHANDFVNTRNVTNDLKTNLKDLYKNICKKSKNEIQYRKTKKIKEEMFKIHV